MDEVSFPGQNGSYRVTGLQDGGGSEGSPSCFKKMRQFRDYLSQTCCACIDTIPSFALVIMAVVLIMLLIAAIPLAFALTYMNPDARVSMVPKSSITPIRGPSVWPTRDEMIRDSSALPQSSSILPPKVSGCKGFGFACTNNPNKVIGTLLRCDGKEDCDDGSDEKDCMECLTSFSCPSREGNGRQLKCLRGDRLCDGISDCMDNSDEDTTHCNRQRCEANEFQCKHGGRCLSKSMRCDGDEHCLDGSDEKGCTECNNGAKMCPMTNKCIPPWKLCDGVRDCPDGSDEMDCNCKTCSGTAKALCDGDKKMCLLKTAVCDGVDDCPGGEDEKNCPGTCTIEPNDRALFTTPASSSPESAAAVGLLNKNASLMVRCGDDPSSPVLKWRLACDGRHPKCDPKCQDCNPETAFTCASSSGPKCVHRSMVCDGVSDCDDGSDEIDCDCNATGMTRCKHLDMFGRQRCYTEAQRCDGVRDCEDGEDERGCESCKNGAFHCLKSKICVPSEKRCDGRPDCPDLTDELNCSCRECSAHPFKMYMCSTGDRCFRMNEVCNPSSQCPKDEKNGDKRDELFCAVRHGIVSHF